MKKKTQIWWIAAALRALQWILMAAALIAFLVYFVNGRRFHLFCGFSGLILAYFAHYLHDSFTSSIRKKRAADPNKLKAVKKANKIHQKYHKKPRYKVPTAKNRRQ